MCLQPPKIAMWGPYMGETYLLRKPRLHPQVHPVETHGTLMPAPNTYLFADTASISESNINVIRIATKTAVRYELYGRRVPQELIAIIMITIWM